MIPYNTLLFANHYNVQSSRRRPHRRCNYGPVVGPSCRGGSRRPVCGVLPQCGVRPVGDPRDVHVPPRLHGERHRLHPHPCAVCAGGGGLLVGWGLWCVRKRGGRETGKPKGREQLSRGGQERNPELGRKVENWVGEKMKRVAHRCSSNVLRKLDCC